MNAISWRRASTRFARTTRSRGVVLDMKPGERYFMRVEIATGFMKGRGRLVLMSREQASYELDSSKLKRPDPDKQRVSLEVVHLQAAAAQSAAPKAAPASSPQIVPASASSNNRRHSSKRLRYMDGP